MALVESKSLSIGSHLPDFSLPTPTGDTLKLSNIMGNTGCLIVFTCNHCPYAIAIWKRLIQLSHWAKEKGVSTVAINPNIHPNYPEDSPENMIKKIKEWNIPFPYLVDQDQKVAQEYSAQCTPDLYLLDHNNALYYHGRLDDCWQDETKVTNEELKSAIQHLSNNNVPPSTQYPSMGCSIKWLS